MTFPRQPGKRISWRIVSRCTGELSVTTFCTSLREFSHPVHPNNSVWLVLQGLTAPLVPGKNRYSDVINILQNLLWNASRAVQVIWQRRRYVVTYLLALLKRKTVLASRLPKATGSRTARSRDLPTRPTATTSLRQTDRTKQVCHEDSCPFFGN